MGYTFEMADGGQHRQHGFNNHADIPSFWFADLQILGITLFRMETMISQNDHSFFKRPDQRMKEGIMNIGSGTIPITYQTFLVKQPTNLAPHDPATVGVSFLSDLLITPTFSAGMQQFNPITIH